ncbi:Rrf2 family transcriptional regulator [Spongiactinospora sp. TRM90649]|uniref:RrF2 family transcriptional regulator n=1 Tax=Spongiactinospora sp. TRM90649 TaxID=3031114 RepID=UPI0023F6E2E7|nr:Rrf2 family transcriptional regulator [Spongiactinospora sp. TRM90649]MDF5753110.1 Rrf2 family transcriptional regulator [Spongiactinospora sp. TRM90649]
MRLTAFTDISLRIVMRLAVARSDELLTTRAVAGMLATPYTHTAKAVAKLSELGVVEARRGRGGGLQLSAKGRGSTVGAIVRALEQTADVVGCDDAPPCPLRAACRLRTALRRAQESFYASLDEVSVASLVDAPTGPVLLSLAPPAHSS